MLEGSPSTSWKQLSLITRDAIFMCSCPFWMPPFDIKPIVKTTTIHMWTQTPTLHPVTCSWSWYCGPCVCFFVSLCVFHPSLQRICYLIIPHWTGEHMDVLCVSCPRVSGPCICFKRATNPFMYNLPPDLLVRQTLTSGTLWWNSWSANSNKPLASM